MCLWGCCETQIHPKWRLRAQGSWGGSRTSASSLDNEDLCLGLADAALGGPGSCLSSLWPGTVPVEPGVMRHLPSVWSIDWSHESQEFVQDARGPAWPAGAAPPWLPTGGLFCARLPCLSCGSACHAAVVTVTGTAIPGQQGRPRVLELLALRFDFFCPGFTEHELSVALLQRLLRLPMAPGSWS